MEYRHISALLTKLAGLILIVYVLSFFPSRIADYVNSPDQSQFLFLMTVLLPISIPLVIASILIWVPNIVATKIVGGDKRVAETPLSNQLQVVLVSLLGLYLCINSVADLLYYAVFHVLTLDFAQRGIFDDPQNAAGLVASGLELILGVVLLFGGRGLSDGLRRLQNAGVRDDA